MINTHRDHDIEPWVPAPPRPGTPLVPQLPTPRQDETIEKGIPVKTFVYVAGPYTKPDPAINTRNAVLVADRLRDAGLIPFVPHLTHLWHLISPADYETWLTYDFQWITKCDALLRMPGESSGADREIGFATAAEIPVFYTVEDLLEWAGVEACSSV